MKRRPVEVPWVLFLAAGAAYFLIHGHLEESKK